LLVGSSGDPHLPLAVLLSLTLPQQRLHLPVEATVLLDYPRPEAVGDRSIVARCVLIPALDRLAQQLYS